MSESTTTGGSENYPTGTAQRLIQRLEDAAADTLFCIEADREEAVEIAAQEIAAALAAQPAPVREGVVPEGWVLVPAKATKTMLDAAYAAHDSYEAAPEPKGWGGLGSVYAAMISAAPVPPVPEPVAPPAGEDLAGLSVILRAVTAGRFRINCKERHQSADPDAGMVWPIEIEMPCINGLSCWFTIGSLYSPDAAAQGYTDGALNDDLMRAFAAHILRSLSVPAPPQPAATGRPSVEEVARAILARRGFGFYTDPTEGGQDAYDISCEALDEAQAVLALFPAPDRGDGTPADGDGWKDISTAPKTDAETMIARPILAFCPEEDERDRVRIVWWEPRMNNGQGGVGKWHDDRDLMKPLHPTHWMPLLPPPPAAGDREGGGR